MGEDHQVDEQGGRLVSHEAGEIVREARWDVAGEPQRAAQAKDEGTQEQEEQEREDPEARMAISGPHATAR